MHSNLYLTTLRLNDTELRIILHGLRVLRSDYATTEEEIDDYTKLIDRLAKELPDAPLT